MITLKQSLKLSKQLLAKVRGSNLFYNAIILFHTNLYLEDIPNDKST